MCYYNGQRVNREEFIRLLNLEKAVSNYGFLDRQIQLGFTYSKSAVLIPTGIDDFEIVEMEWGFLPHYIHSREQATKMRTGYKGPNGWVKGYTMLNATCEGLFVNDRGRESVFANSARERRCLVLSTGFFEWRHLPKTGKKGQELKAVDKYPYFISLKDRDYFFMAGIYRPFTDVETGEHVNTMAIVTTSANFIMSQVHNSAGRMPTILQDELAHEWIFGDLTDERITQIASTQYSPREMQACTISKDFLKELEPTRPVTYETVPDLVLTF